MIRSLSLSLSSLMIRSLSAFLCFVLLSSLFISFFVDDSLPLGFPLLCTALGQVFSLVKVDLNIARPRFLTVSVLVAQLHALHGVHALDKADVLLELNEGIEDEVLPKAECFDSSYSFLHFVPVRIEHRDVYNPHFAKS